MRLKIHSTATNVSITDNLPDVEFVAASPSPSAIQGQDPDLEYWQLFAPIPTGSISLTVQIKERPNIKFDESGSVSGDGYIYDRKMLSTNLEPYSLNKFCKNKWYYDTMPIMTMNFKMIQIRSP